MKIRPLQDRSSSSASRARTKTKGGLIIPDTAKEKPIEGRVVAVGQRQGPRRTARSAPSTCKVGDTVLFGKYSGTEVKLDGVEHVLLREDDILAVTGTRPDEAAA
jgi:chaperonin GroES